MTLTDDEVDAIRHAVACDRHDYGRGMAFDESEHVPDMIRAGFAAGLAAIPREPTSAMTAAGCKAAWVDSPIVVVADIWRAMYDAAQGKP